MGKYANAFQRWNIKRKALKQLKKNAKALRTQLALEREKYQKIYEYFERTEFQANLDKCTYYEREQKREVCEIAARETVAKLFQPYTDYFSSLQNGIEEMMKSAAEIVYAEALQKGGYSLIAQELEVYSIAAATHETNKKVLRELELPQGILTGELPIVKEFQASIGATQSQISRNDVFSRNAFNVATVGLSMDWKTEERQRKQREKDRKKAEKEKRRVDREQKKQAKQLSRNIDKELEEIAKDDRARQRREDILTENIDDKTRHKIGLDESVRVSAAEKVKAKIQEQRTSRKIEQQLNRVEDTKAQREARQNESLSKMSQEEHDLLQRKFGISAPQKTEKASEETTR